MIASDKPFVVSVLPVSPDEARKTPVVAYARVRLGPVTLNRVALLRRTSDGMLVTATPRRYDSATDDWERIVDLDYETGKAVRDAVRAAYREQAE